MRIALKLTAAFLAIASLVGTVGYIAGAAGRTVERQMERLSRSAVVKADTTEMLDALYASQLTAHALVAAKIRNVPADPDAVARESDHRNQFEQHLQRVEQGWDQQWRVATGLSVPLKDRDGSGQIDRDMDRDRRYLESLRQLLTVHRQLTERFLLMVEEDPAQAERFLENELASHFANDLLPLLLAHRQWAESDFTRGIRSTQRAVVIADQQRSLVTLTAGAGAVLLGLGISRRIGRRLSTLQRAAMEMGRGRLQTRVPVHPRDEIGILAASLNRMAADLEERTVSRDYLDNIIHSMRDMLIVTDPELRICSVNPAICAELGFSESELAGRPLADFFASEDFPEGASVFEALAHGAQCRMQTKSGQWIPIQCSAARMTNENGQPEGVVCVASNMSRQKEAELQLLNSLREKELLLKEVHHRVKNNLQVICSLLNLQARDLRDPEAVRSFQESQTRIRSMALVHEQLYRSEDLAGIEFSAYIEQLVLHLKHSFGSSAEQINVCVEVRAVLLPLDLAMPCGMIVNELVSNALQHAFPNDRSGEIRVAFEHNDGGYSLEIADDGVGISQAVAADTPTSLGMKVVQALTRQLHGELDIVERNGGTTFVLRFPGSPRGNPPNPGS